MLRQSKNTTALAALALSATCAHAGLLVYEPFDFAEGSTLEGQGGATGTTGTWLATDSINTGEWWVHAEGTAANIVVAPGPPILRNQFDGTVANLATSGGYAGLPNPVFIAADPDLDFEIGRWQNASIGLDSSVTATFTGGSTTWFSYVTAKGWDRNERATQLTIGSDPHSVAGANIRGTSLDNAGQGIGGGGGGEGPNRTEIFPQYFDGGNLGQANGLGNGAFNGGIDLTDDQVMQWVEPDNENFGAPNIVVGKIEWDGGLLGEDVITVVRFLETDTISEAAFDALIVAQPDLSSANWDPLNQPDLDQSQFDTLSLSGTKILVDEIRIGMTFADVTPIPEPSGLVLMGLGLISFLGYRRRK